MKHYLLVLTSLAWLTACNTNPITPAAPPAATTPTTITNTQPADTRLVGTWAVSPDTQFGSAATQQITFGSNRQFYAQLACNTGIATYENSDTLQIGAIAMTETACNPDLMASEQTLLAILQTLTGYTLNDSDQLVLHSAEGDVTLARFTP